MLPLDTTPNTPSNLYLHSAVQTLHSCLYSQNSSQSDIEGYVLANYEKGDCEYNNALVTAKGRMAIARQFYLLTCLPGELYSDLEDIYESEAFGSNRSFTFTHSVHLSLISWLRKPASPPTSAFSSFVNTPFAHTPRGSPMIHAPARIRINRQSKWPIAQFLKSLTPISLLRSATNLQIKVHSRVEFNERGKVVRHEDIWGIREVIEGLLPLLAPFYGISRLALGTAISIVTGILCPSASSAPSRTDTTTDPQDEHDADDESETSALGLSLRHDLIAFKSLSEKLGQDQPMHLSLPR